MIQVGEDLGLDLLSEAEAVEKHGAGHRGGEPGLRHSDLVLLHIGMDGGADPLLAGALQHQTPAPDAAFPEEVNILHLEANGAFTRQRKFPHKFLEVDKRPASQESAVTVIILKMDRVRPGLLNIANTANYP